MKITDETSLKVAEYLMKVNAVKLQPEAPFTWASGWKSPIYCDNRVTLSFPKIRNFIRQEIVRKINEHFGEPDVIAGVATGAIAMGALVAQEMGLPFVYVRPDAKKHGLGNQIEGHCEKGQTVIVIEDLISTGKSSLNAVKALKDTGCVVKGMISIFTYGFDVSEEAFAKAKCPLYPLSNYEILLSQALESHYIDKKQYESLMEWRKDPEAWTEKHQ